MLYVLTRTSLDSKENIIILFMYGWNIGESCPVWRAIAAYGGRAAKNLGFANSYEGLKQPKYPLNKHCEGSATKVKCIGNSQDRVVHYNYTLWYKLSRKRLLGSTAKTTSVSSLSCKAKQEID